MKHSALNRLVLIGASTGGPGQIEKITRSLSPLSDTTVIIAQHMVKGFIESFAKRLSEHSLNPISVTLNGTSLHPGHIYLCNGMTTLANSAQGLSFINEEAEENAYNPDINTIFNSILNIGGNIKILCVILTGIGDDGVQACRQLSLNGARCITESQESAIVDGMPCRARKDVPNIEVSDIDAIIDSIKEFCS